jgi:hypothetical protein
LGEFGEELVLLGSGFGIVMIVLASLWGVCAITGTYFMRRDAARAAKPAAAPAPAPAAARSPQIAAGVPPAHVAAIAAAVASLSGAYRVIRVSAPAHNSRAWAAQGRYEQQAKWPSQPTTIDRVVT